MSLSSRRARGTGTGGGAPSAGERARYISSLLSSGGGGACTEDKGVLGNRTGNGNGMDEVDEVEMGDAIE